MEKDYLNAKTIQTKTNNFYHIHVVEQIDSTNDFLKRNLQHLPEGFVCIANEQNNGKGRGDHTFHSPKDTSIYLSFVIKPNVNIEDSLLMTLLAALATHNTIKQLYQLDANIKWVNDLYINHKKICGILCESSISNKKIDAMIIGIGINLHSFTMPPHLLKIAACIEDFTPCYQKRNDFIATLLNNFYKLYTDNTLDIVTTYKKHCITLNKWIRVEEHHETYIAKAVDLNEHGHLIIERNHKKIPLLSGDVHLQKL